MQGYTLSQADVDDLVRQIIHSLSPKKIILFGSHARGDFHAGSDLDLCVIANIDQDWFERNLAFKRKIHFENFAVEAHIYTEREWETMVTEERPLALQILQEGRVLYEQK